MGKKAVERQAQKYAKTRNIVLKRYHDNPDAYIADLCERKARIQNEPAAYGALAVLIIGFLWEFFSRYILGEISSGGLVQGAATIEMILQWTGIIVIIGALLMLGVLFYYNRKGSARILLEEYILQEEIEPRKEEGKVA